MKDFVNALYNLFFQFIKPVYPREPGFKVGNNRGRIIYFPMKKPVDKPLKSITGNKKEEYGNGKDHKSDEACFLNNEPVNKPNEEKIRKENDNCCTEIKQGFADDNLDIPDAVPENGDEDTGDHKQVAGTNKNGFQIRPLYPYIIEIIIKNAIKHGCKQTQ